MSDQVHFLTPEGKRKLEEELEFLCTVKRRQVADNLRAAIEEGDITENAAYDESKREQAFLEGRIREVETILANARPLEHSGQCDLVSLGSQVTIIEEGFDPETYTIVGYAEADPSAGRISNESPLGKALIDHRMGDKVEVNTPSGIIHFEIISIA